MKDKLIKYMEKNGGKLEHDCENVKTFGFVNKEVDTETIGIYIKDMTIAPLGYVKDTLEEFPISIELVVGIGDIIKDGKNV